MTPSTGKKGPTRYRYYVAAPCSKVEGRTPARSRACRQPTWKRPSSGLSGKSLDGVAPTGQGQDGAGTDRDLIDIHVAKVVIRRNAIEITKRNLGSDAPAAPVVLPWSPAPAYHRREIIVPPGADRSGQRPIRAESRARLVEESPRRVSGSMN